MPAVIAITAAIIAARTTLFAAKVRMPMPPPIMFGGSLNMISAPDTTGAPERSKPNPPSSADERALAQFRECLLELATDASTGRFVET